MAEVRVRVEVGLVMVELIAALTNRFPALSIWQGDECPVVIVVGVVLNSQPTWREFAGAVAFWPAKSMMVPAWPNRSTRSGVIAASP